MPSQSPPSESQRADRLNSAYLSRQRVHGLTHPVYRYPARFSPEFVNACVSAFTEGGDIVLDPFVGGGTSAVEAMAAGRRFVGFDLNPLAILLTRAKTTPLSRADAGALSDWIERSFASDSWDPEPDDRLKNAPPDIARALVGPVHAAGLLPSERQRDAARAILLDVGQWAIDGRASPASPARLKDAANDALRQLLVGLADLEAAANDCGLKPSDLPNRRVLRAVPARDAASHRGLNRLAGRVRLVVTSPPYPGVHVLYHRWQVGGRAETPMPYWLADQRDGLGPKHYTMGGRSAVGQQEYFTSIGETWQAIRRLLRSDVVVVQLVAFSDPATQYERYLAMMAGAGYVHVPAPAPAEWRSVPNRRWYIRVRPSTGLGREALLTHRLSR